MKKPIFAFVAGLAAWIVVVSLLNRGLRVALPGYVAAESAFAFTLGMQCARLAIGALTSLASGAIVAAIAPFSARTPWVLGAVLTVGFVPEHVLIWTKFPIWYHLTFLLTLAPLVVLGARIVRIRGTRPAGIAAPN